jgi:glycine dehydrogenase subunit 1
MPYIPHTERDVQEMLATLGINSVDALFSEIPPNLRIKSLSGIPDGLSEMEVAHMMRERSYGNKPGSCAISCFIGAGAYDHYIPAAVWDIVTRCEFLTAYTPYQAEGSQGTLQVIYEYQTMICNLMKMDVANASMYDGASALAEAILMAVRANKNKSKLVLLPQALHPAYRQAIHTITAPYDLELVEIPFAANSGAISMDMLKPYEGKAVAAMVVVQPNFFGALEDVDALTDWAHQQGAIVVACVNPTAMALLKAPGEWGAAGAGADVVVGDGQPLGAPLSSGGPFFGFMCCKKDYIRQMPGRIVGRTIDVNGKEGFVLTMQAREQHIRRAKATSNICSNQALMATAATIYTSLLGAEGLRRVALASHANAKVLREKLTAIKGVKSVFQHAFFHEFVITVNIDGKKHKSVADLLAKLVEAGIQGGYDLTPFYPALGNAILVCATETKTLSDLENYAKKLEAIL